jgi:hypothetical protein
MYIQTGRRQNTLTIMEKWTDRQIERYIACRRAARILCVATHDLLGSGTGFFQDFPHVCVCICAYASMNLCVYVSMCMHVYICIRVCVCVSKSKIVCICDAYLYREMHTFALLVVFVRFHSFAAVVRSLALVACT